MNQEQERVLEFHKMFGLTINKNPTIPSDKDITLRINLINEEAKEFEDSSNKKDIIGIADAIADLLYVIYGAAITYGIDIEPIFNEVHRSNMSKRWNDGTIRYNLDGKVIKPPTYSKANIGRYLYQRKY